ncbi:MAG: DNA replication/repair protein RecF [Acutalibacter sp.]|nr:DNA replication/repair protein RecF [Acutalibacter sp.]
MIVHRLGTQQFRNLEDGELFPCEGVNVIYGDNAQGKTNLLEALWLFTGGHSFRGAKDSELPRLKEETGENASAAALALDFFSEERMQKAVLNFENGRRSSVINGVKKKTGSALVGKVRAVIFSPEHLLLVKEGPSRRRSFIDGALCQLKPSFAGALSTYNRALLQRNALLKDIIRFPELRDTLEVWDARLAKLGVGVMAERRAYVNQLAETVQTIYGGISRGKETICIRYSPSVKTSVENFSKEETEELFLQELRRTLRSDMKSGFTSYGPHRDDLEIEINGLSARSYGSQGQQRSAVLALKLAEAETLSKNSGEAPIVLLDDVMSELDQSRQDYLLNHLHGRQVFLTCCSPETVSLQETGKRFRVERGKITPEEVV